MRAARAAAIAENRRDDELYQVSLADLGTGAYNRLVSDQHVQGIMEAYHARPWAMPAIECNMRESGALVVVNGQHRTEAARRLGWTTITAVVHFGWTEAQEAQAFRDSAKGKLINSLDAWWAANLAGEPDVVACQKVITGLGLFVPRRYGDSRQAGALTAVGACMAVGYGRHHGGNARTSVFDPARVLVTLRFCLDTWAESPKRLDGRLLRIVGSFIRKYQDHAAFDLKEATRKLSVFDADEVMRRTHTLASIEGLDIITAGVRVLTALYDKARRGPRLMPVEREDVTE